MSQLLYSLSVIDHPSQASVAERSATNDSSSLGIKPRPRELLQSKTAAEARLPIAKLIPLALVEESIGRITQHANLNAFLNVIGEWSHVPR